MALRRSGICVLKLIVVESPNKIQSIHQFTSHISDWSFGNPKLLLKGAPNADRPEPSLCVPTVGHFMEADELFIKAPRLIFPLPMRESVDFKAPKKRTKRASKASGDVASAAPPFWIKWDVKNKEVATSLVLAVSSNRHELSEVIIATDPDREGELIAQHVWTFLHQHAAAIGEVPPISRAYFHSMTNDGIARGLQRRRVNGVDVALAAAASTRHAMDRLVGFLGSSAMRSVAEELRSMGRVQTPSLVMVRDREEQIESILSAFTASFFLSGSVTIGDVLTLRVTGRHRAETSAKAKDWNTKAAAQQAKNDVFDSKIQLTQVFSTERATAAPLPLSLQALYSLAQRKHKIRTAETLSAAQELFQEGFITYPRTEAVEFSSSAAESIVAHVEQEYGASFLASSRTVNPSNLCAAVGRTNRREDGNVEDAHEAIRPTNLLVTPFSHETQRFSVTKRRIYALVYHTAISAFMKPCVIETLTVELASEDVCFVGSLSRPISLGWKKVGRDRNASGPDTDEGEESETPQYSENEAEKFNSLLRLAKDPTQRHGLPVSIEQLSVSERGPNAPPAHTEASLIEEMKKNEIGRPSTYASIVRNLLDKKYVTLDEKQRLRMTNTGKELCRTASTLFPSFVHRGFTATFENRLDDIAKAQGLALKKAGSGSYKEHLPTASQNALFGILTSLLEQLYRAVVRSRLDVRQRLSPSPLSEAERFHVTRAVPQLCISGTGKKDTISVQDAQSVVWRYIRENLFRVDPQKKGP